MIPKIIHYCWFGGNPLPPLAKKCIASWKKFCPDYEIKEWNESNFDISSNTYTYEAFQCKKWAFITDYVRLWVIYKYGGIYMDTDVEILKPLDAILYHPAFSGFESNCSIPTGIMAGEQNNKWFKLQLAYYDDRHFVRENGSLDLTTNVTTITNITKQNYQINLNNTYQDLKDMVFYPSDFFCPKDYVTGVINITKNTYTIHHFAGSWASNAQLLYQKRRFFLIKYFGLQFGKILSVFPFCVWQIKDNGILVFLKKAFKKYFEKE